MNLDTISQSETSDFKLGEWWVRPQRNELERGEETAHVEARSMSVLVSLARHAPGVVGKELLVQEVWTDSPFVGDDAVSHAIWELRKALGDSARDPAYIQTVPRKGYRLVAEILRPQGSPLPMEGVRIDHYDLGEELGRGSMGVVYRAEDRRLGRTVAIKFLAPELTRDVQACQRFEREARLAASLDHPNLATVHEIGETSRGHRYLVAAYYRGGNLKERLAAGPIEVDEVVRLGRQLVAGLAAAHQREIVHRDIKPANLLLDEHGTLKICDFGIAKLLGATDLTRTGALLGTPAYKSPEQTQGRPVDHRTDLWAVGVVLYELLTSRRPFEGEIEHAVVHSILSREPQILEDSLGRPVPEWLRRVVARALAKDPGERFQSAEEMLAALDRLDRGEESAAAPRTRMGCWVAASIVAGAAIYAVLTWGLRSSSDALQEAPPPAGMAVTNTAMNGLLDLEAARRQWLDGNEPQNLRDVGRLLDRAVERLPSSLEAKALLAAFNADMFALTGQEKHRETARSLINEVLAEKQETALAHAAEAWLLIFEGRVLEAEAQARLAVQLDPDCQQSPSCDLAYVWLSEVLRIQERFEDALTVLGDGMERGAGHIRCRLKRAEFYEVLGRTKEAEDDYEHILDRYPNQTTALSGLGNLYLSLRRPNDAVRPLQKLIAKTGNPKAMLSLGNAYYILDWWDEAIKAYGDAFEEFESTGGGVPTPLLNTGDVFWEQDEQAKARDWYQKALAEFEALENPGIIRLAQRAVCLAKLGRFDEAEQQITALRESSPNVLQLASYAARIYALKGDREELLKLARQWQQDGRHYNALLDDAAFKGFREDREYRLILQPKLEFPD